jgi:hypothetical protein
LYFSLLSSHHSINFSVPFPTFSQSLFIIPSPTLTHASQMRSKSGNAGSGPIFVLATPVVKSCTLALLCALLHSSFCVSQSFTVVPPSLPAALAAWEQLRQKSASSL